MQTDTLTPVASDKFTFGLWTVGNRGRDPFGEFVRPWVDPVVAVERLSKLGAWGVNFHDNDLVPIDATRRRTRSHRRATSSRRSRTTACACRWRRRTCSPTRSSATARSRRTTPASAPTRCRRRCRRWTSAPKWVRRPTCSGAGARAPKSTPPRIPVEAIKRFRDALNFLCEYSRDQKYGFRFALEAKPNEPRGDLYFPTTAAYLAFIPTLQYPEMVGVNPEVAHEHMVGLNFYHAIAQALEAGKLFHIDLNDQKFSRYDQDLRFGSESIKANFFVVKLLEDSGYDGPRHFDAHAYRTEDQEGVWDFARGCMRTYLILKDKAKRFREDKEIQAILASLRETHGEPPAAGLQPRRGRRAQEAHVRSRGDRRQGPGLRAAGSAADRFAARAFGSSRKSLNRRSGSETPDFCASCPLMRDTDQAL